MDAADARFMAQALRLAERGLYSTHPNPRVGCVIVNDGVIVGQGYHERAGAGHAEANALVGAGDKARGATVYCTLEPCAFEGRTPSCASALVAAGVGRVVCAMSDPHPRNAGAGFQILEAAGIEVTYPFMESSARALNPGHVKRFETGLPFVRAKLAMSLDGRTALEGGESRWITGEAARRDVQKLRARSSAIVTGVQTVNDDNPRLTVRADELNTEHAELSASLTRPIVVLDPHGRIDPAASLLDNPNALIVGTEAHDIHGRAAALTLPADVSGRVSLTALLEALAQRECNEVLFECGPTLAGSAVAAGLVDELVVYAAPIMLGGDARALLNLPKIDKMRDRIEWDLLDVRRIGDDLRLTLVPDSRANRR